MVLYVLSGLGGALLSTFGSDWWGRFEKRRIYIYFLSQLAPAILFRFLEMSAKRILQCK